MKQKLHPTAFGLASAVVSALVMLVLSVAASLGTYVGAARRMMDWHMYFSLSARGTITGMIEAAAIAFVLGWAFAYCYNHCLGMVQPRSK